MALPIELQFRVLLCFLTMITRKVLLVSRILMGRQEQSDSVHFFYADVDVLVLPSRDLLEIKVGTLV